MGRKYVLDVLDDFFLLLDIKNNDNKISHGRGRNIL